MNTDEEIRAARFVAEIMMIDAAKEAVDFLGSYFGPVASDDPEGWSDTDAREVHGKLVAALKKHLDAVKAVNADFEITDADWEEALAEDDAGRAALEQGQ